MRSVQRPRGMATEPTGLVAFLFMESLLMLEVNRVIRSGLRWGSI